MSFTRDDLVRFRKGDFVRLDDEEPDRDRKRMSRCEAAWRRWEETGGIARGMGSLGSYGYNQDGNRESAYTYEGTRWC